MNIQPLLLTQLKLECLLDFHSSSKRYIKYAWHFHVIHKKADFGATEINKLSQKASLVYRISTEFSVRRFFKNLRYRWMIRKDVKAFSKHILLPEGILQSLSQASVFSEAGSVINKDRPYERLRFPSNSSSIAFSLAFQMGRMQASREHDIISQHLHKVIRIKCLKELIMNYKIEEVIALRKAEIDMIGFFFRNVFPQLNHLTLKLSLLGSAYDSLLKKQTNHTLTSLNIFFQVYFDMGTELKLLANFFMDLKSLRKLKIEAFGSKHDLNYQFKHILALLAEQTHLESLDFLVTFKANLTSVGNSQNLILPANTTQFNALLSRLGCLKIFKCNYVYEPLSFQQKSPIFLEFSNLVNLKELSINIDQDVRSNQFKQFINFLISQMNKLQYLESFELRTSSLLDDSQVLALIHSSSKIMKSFTCLNNDSETETLIGHTSDDRLTTLRLAWNFTKESVCEDIMKFIGSKRNLRLLQFNVNVEHSLVPSEKFQLLDCLRILESLEIIIFKTNFVRFFSSNTTNIFRDMVERNIKLEIVSLNLIQSFAVSKDKEINLESIPFSLLIPVVKALGSSKFIREIHFNFLVEVDQEMNFMTLLDAIAKLRKLEYLSLMLNLSNKSSDPDNEKRLVHKLFGKLTLLKSENLNIGFDLKLLKALKFFPEYITKFNKDSFHLRRLSFSTSIPNKRYSFVPKALYENL